MQPTTDTSPKLFRQLDYRENDGIEVSLLWNGEDGALSVFVCDIRTNEAFELPVAPDRARETFEHPFAYVVR